MAVARYTAPGRDEDAEDAEAERRETSDCLLPPQVALPSAHVPTYTPLPPPPPAAEAACAAAEAAAWAAAAAGDSRWTDDKSRLRDTCRG